MRASRWVTGAVVALTMVGVAPAQAVAPRVVRLTHVTATVAPSTVYVGTRAVVTGTTTPKSAGSVVVLQRLVSGHWRAVAHVRTGRKGAYALSVLAAKKPGTWALRVVGTGASSKPVHLRITKSRFTVHSSSPGSVQATSPAGAPVVVTGSVTPRTTGHVALQAFSAGAWHTVASALLAKTGTYALGVNEPPGVYRLRVLRAFTKTVAAGTSKTLAVTVVGPLPPPPPPAGGTTPPVAAPTVSISLAGTTTAPGVYSGSVIATITAAAAAGVRSTTYSLDGAAPVAYTGPFAVTSAASHTLVATTTDNAGVVATATAFWTQQATAPGTGISDNFAAGGTVSPSCVVTGFDGVLPNTGGTQCLPGNIAFTPGVGLALTSTAGQLASGTQQNALYKAFDASSGNFTVTARVVGGLGQIQNNYQQIGAFFGPDTNHFVKVEAEHNGAGAPHLTMYYRDNDVPFNNTVATVVPAGLASATTLDLIIRGTAKALTVAYSINGAAAVSVGSSKTPVNAAAWFSSFGYAGIVVANPGASPLTATYSTFSITHG